MVNIYCLEKHVLDYEVYFNWMGDELSEIGVNFECMLHISWIWTRKWVLSALRSSDVSIHWSLCLWLSRVHNGRRIHLCSFGTKSLVVFYIFIKGNYLKILELVFVSLSIHGLHIVEVCLMDCGYSRLSDSTFAS